MSVTILPHPAPKTHDGFHRCPVLLAHGQCRNKRKRGGHLCAQHTNVARKETDALRETVEGKHVPYFSNVRMRRQA